MCSDLMRCVRRGGWVCSDLMNLEVCLTEWEVKGRKM